MERLFLSIGKANIVDADPGWLPGSSYLGALARQGFEARIRIPGGRLAQEIRGFFEVEAAPGAGKSPWDLVAGAGKKVLVLDTTSPDDLRQLVQEADPQLLIYAPPGPIADLPGWDRKLEALAAAAAADRQTTVMAILLPNTAATDGRLVAGGPGIASLSNPGSIDLQDLPPTILWLLDAEPPREMAGRIWYEMRKTDAELTAEEMDILTDHLRGLGYLG